MISFGSNTKVYLATGATDMRKAINGLMVLVQDVLEVDPFSSHLFVFCNRLRNKIKLLMWEDNGFVLYYKALAEEKFRWPRPEDEVMPLSGEQINWLLDGYDISLMKDHRKLHYEASF